MKISSREKDLQVVLWGVVVSFTKLCVYGIAYIFTACGLRIPSARHLVSMLRQWLPGWPLQQSL